MNCIDFRGANKVRKVLKRDSSKKNSVCVVMAKLSELSRQFCPILASGGVCLVSDRSVSHKEEFSHRIDDAPLCK